MVPQPSPRRRSLDAQRAADRRAENKTEVKAMGNNLCDLIPRGMVIARDNETRASETIVDFNYHVVDRDSAMRY